MQTLGRNYFALFYCHMLLQIKFLDVRELSPDINSILPCLMQTVPSVKWPGEKAGQHWRSKLLPQQRRGGFSQLDCDPGR